MRRSRNRENTRSACSSPFRLFSYSFCGYQLLQLRRGIVRERAAHHLFSPRVINSPECCGRVGPTATTTTSVVRPRVSADTRDTIANSRDLELPLSFRTVPTPSHRRRRRREVFFSPLGARREKLFSFLNLATAKRESSMTSSRVPG